MKNNKIKYFLLSLFLCASCTSVSTSVIPSNKPVSSPTPSPVITPVITSTPSILPSTNIIQSPSPVVNSPVPSPTVTTTTSDVSSSSTVNGKVYDDGGNNLNDIKVSIKSLDPNNSFSSESTTVNGSYVFRNVPTGVNLEITAFKSDKWTKRTQFYVAKSNLTGDSTSNVVDFGDPYNFGSPEKFNFYFLTDSPEVIDIEPKNQLLKHDQMTFKITFSEPVRKQSVEQNLYLRYVRDSFSPTTVLGDGRNSTTNTDGPPLLKGNKQVIVDEFVVGKKFTWNTSDFDEFGTEVTFTFDGSNGVLTDNKNQVRYGISLRKDASSPRIIDRDGNIGLIDGEFFVNAIRGKNYIFNVESDRNAPYLQSMILLKNSTNSIIRLNFSEVMLVEGFLNPDLADLSLYKFYKNGVLIDITNSNVNLNSRKSIEILAPLNTFNLGDKIKVEIDPNLKDPAGNFISQGITLGEFDNIREVQYNP